MGNTQTQILTKGVARDHPHIHGEYPAGGQPGAKQTGSPPYTWGIRLLPGIKER